jgi:cytochrome c553
MAATGALAFVLAGSPGRAQEQAALAQPAENTAIGVCGACHGPDGNSKNPIFPSLAGQHAGYLVSQLKSFKEQTRGDPYAIAYMWGMASQLSDATIEALADYFSHQKTGSGRPHPAAVIDRGREIYEHGIPSQGVPACAACHGPNALGNAQFPRLAGQHAEYVLGQFESFQNETRNVAIMHSIALTLNKPQTRLVADYLESLP